MKLRSRVLLGLLMIFGLSACSLNNSYNEEDGTRNALYHWGVFSYVAVKSDDDFCRGRVKNLGVENGYSSSTVRLRCERSGLGQMVWEHPVRSTFPQKLVGTLKGQAVSFINVEPDCNVLPKKFRCE